MIDASKLKQDFPFIQCGLECEKGWNQLIYDLSAELKQMGFNGEVLQIKEKFGGLRYYIAHDDNELYDRMHRLINEYEKKSFTICEMCGSDKGKLLNKNYWYRTRCPECELKEKKQYTLKSESDES